LEDNKFCITNKTQAIAMKDELWIVHPTVS